MRFGTSDRSDPTPGWNTTVRCEHAASHSGGGGGEGGDDEGSDDEKPPMHMEESYWGMDECT